jgi:ribosomal subunit interface protein
MQVPLQITVRNMDHSDALDQHIREKARKLEAFYANLIGCHVTVEELQRHKRQGRLFNVRIHLTMPGGEIAVNRDGDEDVYVALRDAFDAAKRKLEDYARKQRGDIKVHEVRQHGRVTGLVANEGYGFIETADGREFHFSYDNVAEPSFDQLKIGTEVQFLEELADEGLRARRITVGKHHIP